ncbi:uncharacterized protein LOC126559440 [Anopheles maculipalpis]|uniref:uncharacterized protein LOC126559440 n=1 Tax=Anopheles maculipalpis TaxID=1496333 RepID=UPI00215918A6|nr:uncharacterized protein LOC126559440 [Anopheles maculipalpis]
MPVMKRTFVSILLIIACFELLLAAAKQDDETQNGPLLDRLLRFRRQSGGVNYGFPTFPDFGRQGQLPNFGQQGLGGGGGLFSRSDFSDFMPDPSQFKGNQVWTTKSCVYDEKGKEKCVERHGDKPKH